jgi:hypothetical protein
MYGYGYRYNSGLVVGAGGGTPFTNTYSLDFDGIDDYVDTNSTKFSGASEFSISMWANFTSLSGNNPIVSNWFSGVTNYIVRYSSTKLQFYISTTGGVAKVTEYTFTPTLSTWYNIICVYNGSNISIYINGTQQGTPTAITGTVLANTNNCLIGERGTEHFSGIVDEVSYFNRALTPTEITSISSAPTDLTDLSPIAWFRMGDNGSYKSPQWLLPNNENKDKVSNYSFELDGIDDYIDCGNGALDITSSITLSCWVKSTNTGSNRKIIVKDDAGSNRSFQININHPSLGPYTYFWLGGGNIKSVSTGIPNQIVDGNWHHVVSVFKSGQYIRMYIDGVQAANTNVTETTLDSANTNFLIGTDGYGGTVGIDGAVDEVSVFDSALDSIEIASLYNGGEPTTISGAVAHWRMGEEATFSTNWTVSDAVGSNDGTSNAMTIEDRVGEAPNSDNNALSYNMDLVDRVTDTP